MFESDWAQSKPKIQQREKTKGKKNQNQNEKAVNSNSNSTLKSKPNLNLNSRVEFKQGRNQKKHNLGVQEQRNKPFNQKSMKDKKQNGNHNSMATQNKNFKKNQDKPTSNVKQSHQQNQNQKQKKNQNQNQNQNQMDLKSKKRVREEENEEEEEVEERGIPMQPQEKKLKLSGKNSFATMMNKMKTQLSGAKFRWINEQLYTEPSQKSFEIFQEDPNLFEIYHEGFRSQVESWPSNPVDIFISYLEKQCSPNSVIADFGCGDAKIAQTLHEKIEQIHSFDLVAKNDYITACDIAKVPLKNNSVDIAIFCLSLMGTNFIDFLKEAYRVLKPQGQLKIAEVVSRFESLDKFLEVLTDMGFKLVSKDDSNKMFILLDFVKTQTQTQPKKNKNKDSKLESKTSKPLLKPCLYKKR